MNTFKTIVVVATLLGVGYGVHVVLNKPIPNESARATPGDDWGIPTIITDAATPAIPDEATMQPPALSSQFNSNGNTSPPPLPKLPELPALTPPIGIGQSSQAQSNVPAGTNGVASLPSGAAPFGTATERDEMWPDSAPPVEPSGGPSHAPDSLPPSNGIATTGFPDTLALSTTPQGGPPSDLPAESSAGNQAIFEQVWQSAQAKLQAGQLFEALFTLSLWYSDPNLSTAERDRLIPLLDQLAGTVIYSQEHHLEQPHTIQDGESLKQIAASHKVTPEFLARINGLTDPSQVTAGRQLKVISGPFRAEVNLRRREITVFCKRVYAGRFSCGIGRDLPPGEISLAVAEKVGARAYVDPHSQQRIEPNDPSNPYGQFWIGLNNPVLPPNASLGIHSVGANFDAADTRGCISVDPKDADDLAAILSIGSKVQIMR